MLPDMPAEERDKGEAKGYKALVIMTIVNVGIGLGIAWAIYAGDSAYYDKKIEANVKAYDLQWGFLACFLFTRLVAFLNTYPGIWKNRVMRGSDGNLRANM